MKVRLAAGLLVVIVGAAVVGGCVSSAVLAQYDAGKSLQSQKNYEEAIQKYEDYIAGNPESALVPHALLRVARCYAELGDKPNAAAAYKKVSDQFPTSDAAACAGMELSELEKEEAAPDAAE